MATKTTKVHDMTLEDLEKKLGNEGRNSVHWGHMLQEVKNRAANTHDLTREGKVRHTEAQKLLEKFVK